MTEIWSSWIEVGNVPLTNGSKEILCCYDVAWNIQPVEVEWLRFWLATSLKSCNLFVLFFFCEVTDFCQDFDLQYCQEDAIMAVSDPVVPIFPCHHDVTTCLHESWWIYPRFGRSMKALVGRRGSVVSGWWFQTLFIFNPIWGRFPFWLIFFKWVETVRCVWSKCWFIETQSSTSRWLQESLDACVIWERFYHGWYGKRCWELGFCLSIARAPMCEQGFLPRSKRFRAW